MLVGRCFEIQIELLDSYKRLNKAAPISQVLITPEFYGHEIPPAEPTDGDSEGHDESLLNLVVVTQDNQKKAAEDEPKPFISCDEAQKA